MEYCALTFNGQLLDQLIPGYTTANVEGRGLLDRVLSTVDIPGRDGSFVLIQKLPPRSITVYYALKAPNAREKQNRLESLHNALTTNADVQFKFGDEDYYRYGRLKEVEDPPHDQLQGIGSFLLYCQDPYKYKVVADLTGASITLPPGPLYPYKINLMELVLDARAGLTVNNISTGKKIVLTGAFMDGQVLQIYSDKILLDGQNIMNRLDFINSDWREFELHPGNTITAPVSFTLSLEERAL